MSAPLATPPRLVLREIRRSFGATHALRGVSLEVHPGEILVLAGENGAGKSTLMHIVSGALAPDGGTMEMDGCRYAPAGPLEARAHGVAMIHQELTLAPHLSVVDNIFLGMELHRWGWRRSAEMRARARKLLGDLGQEELPVDALAGELPIAKQQMVEIARALAGSPRLLIMDEPTSSLSRTEAELLFQIIQSFPARGISVIYISHFLEEGRRLGKRCAVLRDGQSVATVDFSSTRDAEIIRAMVGREVQDIYPRVLHAPGEVVMEARGIQGSHRPTQATFSLKAGEILGIAGLIGAGRTETLRAIFGLDRLEGGTLVVSGRECRGHSPRARWREGIGFVSEDRKGEGLMADRSIVENITLSRPVGTWGWIRRGEEVEAADAAGKRLGLRCRSILQPLRELSGGNQQKVAVARLLHHPARILLLDEPTRGIDVGSKAEIYRIIGELAAEGKAVVLVSSYLPELLGVCDRIAVMAHGRLGRARPVTEWTEENLGREMVGG